MGHNLCNVLFTRDRWFSKLARTLATQMLTARMSSHGIRCNGYFKATHEDHWVIADNKRDKDNVVVGQLFPSKMVLKVDQIMHLTIFSSNGFKFVNTMQDH